MKKLICEYCSKEIKPKEAHCTLDSKFNGKITHTYSWHSECWRNKWNEKMDRKVREYANKFLEATKPMLEKLSEGRYV